ncbi:MAG: hypothetical protein E7270_00220 [Lachnospiraceae bacterium]|nr:hypothetical protein [Lachnospiraceae bacterium]
MNNIKKIRCIKNSPLFDRIWYIQNHPEVDFTIISPEKHYLTYGYLHNCNPSNLFSNEEYYSLNPDVKDSGMCPLLHYEKFGKHEGRCYGVSQPYTNNVYSQHKLPKAISSFIGKVSNHSLIQKNKDVRILVCLHLYYTQSFGEIKLYLNNLSCYNYDLCITYTEGMLSTKIYNQILDFKPDARIFPCVNKGFDVGPYIEALNYYDLSKYDVVFKLHSKGTARKKIFIYNHYFEKDDWFKYLYEGILGYSTIHKTIDVLTSNNDIGLVAAGNLIVKDPIHKQNLLKQYVDKLKLGWNISDYEYVAGTCFALRSELAENIKRLHLGIDDFPNSRRGNFSFAHAMERIICMDILAQGYKFLGNKVCPIRQHKDMRLSKPYADTCALRLLEDKRFSLDDEFFYRSLEHRKVKFWEIIHIPLNTIIRKWFDGTCYSLTECAPYKYLKGDTKTYDEYCKYHHENNLPDMTRNRFDKLINSIKNDGYNPKNIIVINQSNILLDGQHRACCLMHLYGENYTADVLKIYFG